MDIVFSIIIMGISLSLTYFVLPFLKLYLNKKQLQLARDVITDIVAALEDQEITGGEKKELALKIAKELLKLKKIRIPDMFINALIESSLYFLRKQFSHSVSKKMPGEILSYSVKEGKLN